MTLVTGHRKRMDIIWYVRRRGPVSISLVWLNIVGRELVMGRGCNLEFMGWTYISISSHTHSQNHQITSYMFYVYVVRCSRWWTIKSFPYRDQIGTKHPARFFPNWTPKFMAPWQHVACNVVRGLTLKGGEDFSFGTQEKSPALRKLAKDDRVASWWVELCWFLFFETRWKVTMIEPHHQFTIFTCDWWRFFLLRRRSATPWGWVMKRSPIPNGDIRNRWQPRLGARCESWCWWYFISKSEMSLLFHASFDVIQVWRGQVQAVAEKQKTREKAARMIGRCC